MDKCYHGSQVALVCFDNHNIRSVPEWVQRVHEQEPQCIIFLVLTKKDTLNEEEMNQAISEGNHMKNQVGAKNFFITSASLNTGIKELFKAVAECFLEIYPEEIKSPKPVSNNNAALWILCLLLLQSLLKINILGHISITHDLDLGVTLKNYSY